MSSVYLINWYPLSWCVSETHHVSFLILSNYPLDLLLGIFAGPGSPCGVRPVGIIRIIAEFQMGLTISYNHL